MASVTTLPTEPRSEHRRLFYWMDRVLKELQKVRSAPDPDAVHDLRVAIRRCRSYAAILEEVDPAPAWPEMRRVARKLFRGLGALRDTQVMSEWVKQLGAEGDPIRSQLQASFQKNELDLRSAALRMAAKFDDKKWKRMARTLRGPARLVPSGSLAAECLALERFEHARELHVRALRTEKPAPWHKLRIGLKKFRYTVESLLPEHHAAWSHNLKRVQDLLGEIHDLDMLAVVLKQETAAESELACGAWERIIERERHERMETYRRLTLGKTSLWHEWRHALPHGERLEAAAMARLRATARAMDANPRRTSQVSRLAQRLFETLARAGACPAFDGRATRRILRAAARLHGIGASLDGKSPGKSAQKFLLALALPPGWTGEEWELLAATVRYHRGAEPKTKHQAFGNLSEEQRKTVKALAGVLRLARVLRKYGVEASSSLRAEKSVDALILHVPGLSDTKETAARIAAGKHLLETSLEIPLILKAAPGPQPVLQLPAKGAVVMELAGVASD
jgi:CHAD domain-containing protein